MTIAQISIAIAPYVVMLLAATSGVFVVLCIIQSKINEYDAWKGDE